MIWYIFFLLLWCWWYLFLYPFKKKWYLFLLTFYVCTIVHIITKLYFVTKSLYNYDYSIMNNHNFFLLELTIYTSSQVVSGLVHIINLMVRPVFGGVQITQPNWATKSDGSKKIIASTHPQEQGYFFLLLNLSHVSYWPPTLSRASPHTPVTITNATYL